MNWDPTPYGDSSPTCNVSNWTRFKDHNLWPSGEASVSGYGLGRSLVLITGRVLICSLDIFLLTSHNFPPAAARPSVFPARLFPGGRAQRSFSKEGGKTPPPPPSVSDYSTARSGITAATGGEFALVSITIVADGSLC